MWHARLAVASIGVRRRPAQIGTTALRCGATGSDPRMSLATSARGESGAGPCAEEDRQDDTHRHIPTHAREDQATRVRVLALGTLLAVAGSTGTASAQGAVFLPRSPIPVIREFDTPV